MRRMVVIVIVQRVVIIVLVLCMVVVDICLSSLWCGIYLYECDSDDRAKYI